MMVPVHIWVWPLLEDVASPGLTGGEVAQGP